MCVFVCVCIGVYVCVQYMCMCVCCWPPLRWEWRNIGLPCLTPALELMFGWLLVDNDCFLFGRDYPFLLSRTFHASRQRFQIVPEPSAGPTAVSPCGIWGRPLRGQGVQGAQIRAECTCFASPPRCRLLGLGAFCSPTTSRDWGHQHLPLPLPSGQPCVM